jgi:hypothetical protein
MSDRYTLTTFVNKKTNEHGAYITDTRMGLLTYAAPLWANTQLDLLNAGDKDMHNALKWQLAGGMTDKCIYVKAEPELMALSRSFRGE